MPKRSYVRLNIPESTLPPAVETSLPTTAEGLTIDGIGVSFTETGTTTLKANYNHNTVVTYDESIISLEGGQSSPISGTIPSGTSLPGMPFDTVIGPFVIKSVGVGETQIVFQPDNTDTFSSVTVNVKVTSSDDSSFLNKRGLEYFWDKIDDKKQDKLTAGLNITISGNTISATQPTVNNATLTIQKNGTTVNTFTANASSNVTANITTPEIKRRTGGTTTTDITPVYVAGDGTNTPMALKTHGDSHTGSFAYVNINEPTGDISEAYIGGYVWDEYEDWWRKMSEKKLALYSDIPTVNNGTLTIQKNGTNVQTFTANQSSNVTANISVPTATSGLTNDGSDGTAAYLETDETAYATASIPYAKVDSTSTATEYTATVPGITQLRQGVSFWLENGVVTSASGFTVNINGLGAKPVYTNLAASTRDTTIFNVNYTMLFVYDADRVSGGAFICYRGYDANTNTIGYQLRTNSSTLPAKQTGYRYRLWFTSADGQNYVPINTATGTSTTATKALNTTTPIDPFGAIVYNSTNGTVNADASLPAGTQWTQYALDMRYQKYPLTLTYPDPVYLQCTPQSAGGALINDVVQALPSADDGKIYIYLGTAYSATSIELKPNHPVYYYKDGAIRLYTNQTSSGGSSYTAGDGIKIENGVISLDLTNANNVEY